MKPSLVTGVVGVAALFAMCAGAAAQNNAVPFLNQSLNPTSIGPGSKTFTLTVSGAGFASSAVVNWNRVPQLTEFISSDQLKATISSADIAKAQTAWITVTNPPPGGGTSNVVFFPITESSSSIGMAITQTFPNATAVAVGDFNNDGKLDVAWIGNGVLNVSLGNGKGGFAAPIVIGGDFENAIRIVTGDFNGDGKLDLACLTVATVTVFLGNGDGTFTQSFYSDPFNGGTEGIGVADFNQDGHLDLYVGGWETGPMLFFIYFGNGDGTFSGGYEYETGFDDAYGVTPGSPAIGDFNGDGYLDLAIGGTPSSNPGTIEIFLGGPAGTFSESTTISLAAVNLATAGVNNGGNLDLITDYGCVLLGNGNGTFGPCTSLADGGEISGIGDFSGSRNLDIVTGSGNVAVNLGAGNGSFPNAVVFSGVGGSGAIGDFNNDGKLDIVSGPYLLLQTTVDLTPTALAFGSQNVGTTSAPQAATFTNVGTSAMPINHIAIAGIGSKYFSQANDCGDSLAAGASCTINVTFAPKAGGTFTPLLSVSYEGTASPETVTLSGTGLTPPTVSLLPSTLTFATQLVGTSSSSQIAKLTNTGDQNLTISSISVTDAFSQTNDCGPTLPSGYLCQIEIVFTPTTAGAASGMLSVTDNASNSPQQVKLSGIGTVITFTPTAVNFGDQNVGTTSLVAPITVANVGSVAVAINSISITGADPGDFSETSNCGSRLPANGSCTINVRFKPTATGARSATVSVADTGGGSPQTVALSGTGT